MFDDDDADEECGDVDSDADLLERIREVIPEYSNIPAEVVDIAVEMARLNGGKLPEGQNEIDGIVSRNPEMRSKIDQLVLQLARGEGIGPFGELDFGEPGDLDDELPSRPSRPRRRKKRRRRR